MFFFFFPLDRECQILCVSGCCGHLVSS
jgi:hypothetical protein